MIFKFDFENMWLVTELGGASGVLVHTFQHGEAAQQFSETGERGSRQGPFPIRRYPLEQAAPFAIMALVTAKNAIDDGLKNQAAVAETSRFIRSVLDMAALDPNLASIYRDCRKAVLFEKQTPADDPQFPTEQALCEFLQGRAILRLTCREGI